MYIYIYIYIYIYRKDLVLNDLQWSICHKTKPTQTKFRTVKQETGQHKYHDITCHSGYFSYGLNCFGYLIYVPQISTSY